MAESLVGTMLLPTLIDMTLLTDRGGDMARMYGRAADQDYREATTHVRENVAAHRLNALVAYWIARCTLKGGRAGID